jgi:hypothetical protein
MSVIHWDKSVLSLHLKEMIEDHHKGDRTAMMSLGVILLSTIVLPATVKLAKPIVKNIIKSSLEINQKM